MMCETAGEVTAQTRSKSLQLGAIFCAYSKVRRYLLYLSKQLYNPQHIVLCFFRVEMDVNAYLGSFFFIILLWYFHTMHAF